MEALTTLRMVGLGGLVVVFIATVLPMPRIFGVNREADRAEKRDPTLGS